MIFQKKIKYYIAGLLLLLGGTVHTMKNKKKNTLSQFNCKNTRGIKFTVIDYYGKNHDNFCYQITRALTLDDAALEEECEKIYSKLNLSGDSYNKDKKLSLYASYKSFLDHLGKDKKETGYTLIRGNYCNQQFGTPLPQKQFFMKKSSKESQALFWYAAGGLFGVVSIYWEVKAVKNWKARSAKMRKNARKQALYAVVSALIGSGLITYGFMSQ